MVGRVCSKRDGGGDGSRADGQRQCERIKGAAENVGGVHVLLDLAALVGIFLRQEGPAVGNDDEAAADLHDRDRDAKEGEDVRADEVGGDDEKETVEGDAAGEQAAGGFSVIGSEGEKDGAAADRINDGEESADNEKDAFCDFEQENLRNNSIAETEMGVGLRMYVLILKVVSGGRVEGRAVGKSGARWFEQAVHVEESLA